MKKYQLTLLSLCVAAFAQAKVTLPSFFTDNMVIQQNSQLTLPGKAKAGKQVTVKVSWNYEKYTAKASADGHFSIEVPTPPAGGPFQITVSDGEKLVLNNVLSGEVWICSGQSNMQMPVEGWGKVKNYQQEVAQASRKAKLLAKELHIPVILLSQLNRGSENRVYGRLELADLRESGAIEQDSDLVVLLYRPALAHLATDKQSGYPTEGLGIAIIAKHRNGETGNVYFGHNRSMTKIGDYVPPTEWIRRNAK